jgi:hypothetical protein
MTIGASCPLKLVDSSYPRSWQPFLKLEDLSVVRRDYQDILKGDCPFGPRPIDPGCTGTQNIRHEVTHLVSLFGRRILITFVSDGEKSKPGPVYTTGRSDFLHLKPWARP